MERIKIDVTTCNIHDYAYIGSGENAKIMVMAKITVPKAAEKNVADTAADIRRQLIRDCEVYDDLHQYTAICNENLEDAPLKELATKLTGKAKRLIICKSKAELADKVEALRKVFPDVVVGQPFVQGGNNPATHHAVEVTY